jgi:hypothetical protein
MLCTGWRCRGVKVLPLSVVFPVWYISSVSPRFYFRRHAFCFLPLAAIFKQDSFTLSWTLIESWCSMRKSRVVEEGTRTSMKLVGLYLWARGKNCYGHLQWVNGCPVVLVEAGGSNLHLGMLWTFPQFGYEDTGKDNLELPQALCPDHWLSACASSWFCSFCVTHINFYMWCVRLHTPHSLWGCFVCLFVFDFAMVWFEHWALCC